MAGKEGKRDDSIGWGNMGAEGTPDRKNKYASVECGCSNKDIGNKKRTTKERFKRWI